MIRDDIQAAALKATENEFRCGLALATGYL